MVPQAMFQFFRKMPENARSKLIHAIIRQLLKTPIKGKRITEITITPSEEPIRSTAYKSDAEEVKFPVCNFAPITY